MFRQWLVGDRPAWSAARSIVRTLALSTSNLLLVVNPPGLAALSHQHDSPHYVPAGDKLAAADVDMIIRVRLAGLWEIPAGEMAQQQALRPIVKQVGATLRDDHAELDRQVRAVAAQLGIALPDQPNAIQRQWLEELSGKTGDDFDKAFAFLLRGAHGAVFSTVAAVRASTTNDVVRQFAQIAVDIVMKHMQLLESIGVLDYSSLTPAPHPPLSRVPFSERPLPDIVFVWIVLAIAVLAGTYSIARTIRLR
jgi:predicted outer membrane protein